MKKPIWIGILAWGILITCFGVGAANPENVMNAAPLQEVVFLLAAGGVTSLVGMLGLIVSLGWIQRMADNARPPRSIYHLGR